MKRASWALGVLAAIAFLWPGLTMQKNLAVAATPTPVALQYDQIVRVVIPPATPPAPGAFAADYAAITGAPAGTAADASAATPTPAPKKHGGLGGFISSVVSGQPPGGSEDTSGMPPGIADQVRAMRQGTLTRYTYYKGWLRTDDVVHQTAVISKCQEHQYITLDLAKKTYTMTNTKPACATTPQMPMGARPQQQVENEAPGTVDMTIANNAQNLGPLTIEAIATNGFDNTLQMSMTNATGSCRNASMGMKMLQYVSKIPVPHPYCPLPKGANSYDPSSFAVQGGCKPTMHTSGGGAAMFDMDKLVMFSKMTFNAGGGDSMGGYASVTQRGNVKWLSGAPADALFTVPPGFTKAN